MLRIIPLVLIVCLGAIGVIVFGYSSLIDWNALQQAYTNFVNIAKNSPDLATLFTAEAEQNIHRINLFAEGVWTLQSAVVSAIGLHGIYTVSKSGKTK
jgi:hypothetical protein